MNKNRSSKIRILYFILLILILLLLSISFLGSRVSETMDEAGQEVTGDGPVDVETGQQPPADSGG